MTALSPPALCGECSHCRLTALGIAVCRRSVLVRASTINAQMSGFGSEAETLRAMVICLTENPAAQRSPAASCVILPSRASFLRAFNGLMRRNFTFLPRCCSGLSTRIRMAHAQVSWQRVKTCDARSRAPDQSRLPMLVFWLCCGWWKMRAFTIAAIIAVLAVPANAQMGPSNGGGGGGGVSILGGGGGGGKLGKKSDEQIAIEQQQKKNEENAYRDALKKIQPAKPSDPWGSMR
jgi:hypothetical protein